MAPASSRSGRPPRGPARLAPPRISSTDARTYRGPTHTPRPGPSSLLSRLEAVDRDADRRRFALYGRQHAHVDHLSGREQDTSIVLQSTMLLQEDGLLAARLDDVTYLVDGLLEPAKTQRGRLAQARSVLELTQLFQDQKILQAVELSSQRRRIQDRMKMLLTSRLTEEAGAGEGGDTYQVSLAVLVYFLSGSAGVHDYFDEKVMDALMHALKRELEDGEKRAEKGAEVKASVAVSHVGAHPLEKTCLKRKGTRLVDKVVVNGECKSGALASEAKSTQGAALVADSPLATSTVHILDDLCRMRLNELFQDHDAFFVEGEVQISMVNTLCAALHNLVQVDDSSSSSSSRTTEHCQQQLSAYSGDAARETFRLLHARRRRLVQNGGVNILVNGLAKRLSDLEGLLPLTQADGVAVECAHSLHYIRMLLRIFDQMTFLTMDVQQHISKQRALFALLLKLIRLLSNLCWGIHARERWDATSARMSLAVEVFVSGLRALINLTHHNMEAASYVHSLGGMQQLANVFYQVWGGVSTAATAEKHSLAQDKWEFDSCLLLLSVMANCIEFSVANRDALVTASLCLREPNPSFDQSSLGVISAYDLFVRFFLAKVESYKHLLDSTEGRGANESISNEEETDDWNPEDAILGGCTSLLLGYLMTGSTTNSAAILKLLPDNSPRLLLRALSVFVAFHSQIGALTGEVAKSVLHVEKVLKSCQRSEFGVVQSDLLETGATNTSLGICGAPIPAAMSGVDADLSSAVSTDFQSNTALPSTLRVRSLKNVCSNLDDSDEDNEPNAVQDKLEGLKANSQVVVAQSTHAFGIRTPTRTSPISPNRKRPREKSPVRTPPVSRTNKTSPPRGNKSSPITVLPDGTLSSPVVARLLKRTRQLMDELDAEFANSSHSAPVKKSDDSSEGGTVDTSSSPCVVLTVDVTCRDNGSDDLDLSQDNGDDNYTNDTTNGGATEVEGRAALTSMRREKSTRDLDTSKKSATVYHESLIDFASTNMPPSTPLRKVTSKVLLQTPTRTESSPGSYRQSPSVNLTPTKTYPSTPLRMKKSSGMLQTPTKNDPSPVMDESPVSVCPHRRKTKAVRAPASACAGSIFDFTD